jgi:gliding motility-associated protein GldM
MIGMMYLVLTAMLALNVSTDILNGFTLVDDSLHSSIAASDTRNAKLYNDFKAANADNPEKTQEWYDKAMRVKAQSDSLYNYIQEFKDQMVRMVDGSKAVANAKVAQIGKQDDTNIPHQYGLKEGHGAELKEHIIAYRNFLKEIAEQGDSTVMGREIDAMFATDQAHNAEGDLISWEEGIFHEMPMCASITVLTKLQNDVRSYEGKIVQFLMSGTDAADLRVNKLDAYVIPKSDYVIRGSKYSAKIILAAVDSTQQPEYYIEGQRINDEGIYEVVATGSGPKKFKGQIAYLSNLGEMQYLDFTSEYTVGEPSVTISNTDLNIMYRGYENQFSISVPGVSSDKVKVSVNGAAVSRRGAFWIIKPGDGAKSVTISVSAELEGKMQQMGSQTYRVKALPKPGAYFKSGETEYSDGFISRGALLNSSASVIASYGPDGLLDLPFKITSFKVNINGVLTESKGDKFTKQQLDQLGKLKKGAVVVITDVRAKGPDGKDTRLSPIPLSLN